MPAFFTRVELHGASGDDYETLHTAMAQSGFYREITDDIGGRFLLPSATYYSIYSDPSVTAEAVREQARRIGNSVKPSCWVLTISLAADWSGWLHKFN